MQGETISAGRLSLQLEAHAHQLFFIKRQQLITHGPLQQAILIQEACVGLIKYPYLHVVGKGLSFHASLYYAFLHNEEPRLYYGSPPIGPYSPFLIMESDLNRMVIGMEGRKYGLALNVTIGNDEVFRIHSQKDRRYGRGIEEFQKYCTIIGTY